MQVAISDLEWEATRVDKLIQFGEDYKTQILCHLVALTSQRLFEKKWKAGVTSRDVPELTKSYEFLSLRRMQVTGVASPANSVGFATLKSWVPLLQFDDASICFFNNRLQSPWVNSRTDVIKSGWTSRVSWHLEEYPPNITWPLKKGLPYWRRWVKPPLINPFCSRGEGVTTSRPV